MAKETSRNMVKENQQKHGKGKNSRNILKGNQQKHGKGKPAETL